MYVRIAFHTEHIHVLHFSFAGSNLSGLKTSGSAKCSGIRHIVAVDIWRRTLTGYRLLRSPCSYINSGYCVAKSSAYCNSCTPWDLVATNFKSTRASTPDKHNGRWVHTQSFKENLQKCMLVNHLVLYYNKTIHDLFGWAWASAHAEHGAFAQHQNVKEDRTATEYHTQSTHMCRTQGLASLSSLTGTSHSVYTCCTLVHVQMVRTDGSLPCTSPHHCSHWRGKSVSFNTGNVSQAK